MTPQAQSKTWFITGASTGFGRLLAEEVLQSGGKVIATARSLDKVVDLEQKYPEQAKAYALDVTDPAQVISVVAQATACFSPVDVLVNNAGYGLAGAIEEATEDEFMPVFNTNVFGLISVTRAFLPHLRQRGHGHIVNLSSVGGLIGSPGCGLSTTPPSSPSKASPRHSPQSSNPSASTSPSVEPGPFRTDFLGRSGVEAEARIPDYDATAGKTREYFHTQAGKQPGDPVRAVKAIVAAVESPKPPRHLLLGKLALTRFRKRLEDWKSELDTWEQTTVGADFPEGELQAK